MSSDNLFAMNVLHDLLIIQRVDGKFYDVCMFVRFCCARFVAAMMVHIIDIV